jgi:thiamine biosynthesis protein ThiS
MMCGDFSLAFPHRYLGILCGKIPVMTLHINGNEREFSAAEPFTLTALVDSLQMKPDRVAVELNREIVPRDRWPETQLHEGDSLEIVHFVGGGTAAL